MISYSPPDNHVSCDEKNYTIASTFEKAKSLKFELLFGDWKKRVGKDGDTNMVNAVDYYFLPSQIFGFMCHSYGSGFKHFHHAFVVRACAPCEIGAAITGIVPGAEILVATSTSVATSRLISLISILKNNKVEPTQISVKHYRKLHYLLNEKLKTDYFVGELISEKNPW